MNKKKAEPIGPIAAYDTDTQIKTKKLEKSKVTETQR